MIDSSGGVRVGRMYQALLRGWLVVVAFGILGSLIGYGWSRIRRPQYEAQAVLSVGINYGVTKPLELVVEDRVLYRIYSVILSDSTLALVLERLPQEARESLQAETVPELRAHIRLDRRLSEWALVSAGEDPATLATTANTWASVTVEVLREAQSHASRAIALQGGQYDVQCDTGVAWECWVSPLTLDPESLSGMLQNEIEQSKGILPNITFEITQEAFPPAEPTIWDREELVLAGMLLGVLVAVAALWARELSRRNG